MTSVLERGDQTAAVRERRRKSRGGGRGAIRFLTGLTPLVLLVLFWQLFGDYQSPYFPTPHAWWDGVEGLREQGLLWSGIATTLRTFLAALVLNTVIGAAIGFLMGWSRLIDRCFGPTTEFIRAIPSAAIVPVLFLIMGIGTRTNIVVVVVGTLWPVLISTRAAVRQMNPLLSDVARTLGMSRRAWLVKIAFPSLLPSILVGIQVMAPMTLIVTLLVEIITGDSGVGGLLATAQQSFLAAQVYGMVCVAGMIALVVNVFVTFVEHYASRYLR
jgi:ABC-type nitrate/sulfonate/bicarbonate transport system permease component